VPTVDERADQLRGEGVLADHHIRDLIESGTVTAADGVVAEQQIQPASLDLTIGKTAHRLRASFLSDRGPVEAKLKELSQGTIDLQGGGFLEHNVPYLIELRERLALPEWIRAKANPKSSTGRLDVFTRVITDHGFLYDEIRAGYHGQLFLEVVPISFPIRVREGLSLNQVRFLAGDVARLDDKAIRAEHRRNPLLYRDGTPVPIDALQITDDRQLSVSNGLLVSVDLTGDRDGVVGYKARSHTPLLDLTSRARPEIHDFWEAIQAEQGPRIILEPDSFYLLLSREGISIPPMLASEMVAYDPTSGELRTHYAGFFDPGFGFGRGVKGGSRAALEVRAHDVPFVVEHGQAVCKLAFEPMIAKPSRLYGSSLRSHYQRQETTLSKYFLPH
jgi:dCTP deaminase